MDTRTLSSIRRWLAYIMPDAVASILRMLTPEEIAVIGQEQAVHGPYTVDIEHLRGPIKGIILYVMSVDDSMMLAVVADIKGVPEDYSPILSFDFFFMVNEFPAEIGNEENRAKLVDILVRQCEECPYA